MQILYHHRTLADGAEGVHIAAIADAFRALGHTVHLSGFAPAATEDRSRRRIERIRSLVPGWAFEAASLLLNVPDYFRTRRALQRCNAAILYKRHGKYDVGAVLAARHLRIPVLLEVNCVFTHGSYEQFEPLRLRGAARAFERLAFRMATVAVAVSTPLARQVCESGQGNTVVVPNGADPAAFDPARADGQQVRAAYGITGRFTVGWVGILREWHGVELLLEAVSRVPGATALIVGDGPARHLVERRAETLGIGDRLVITGRVSHVDMPAYIAAMDVAVVPAERTGVASPMKVLEYMAMGRAVVAPAAENLRDLIDDGVDGLLFPPGSAADLAAAVSSLAGDAELRRTLGTRARRKILTCRNWRAIAVTILASMPSPPTAGTSQ